MGCCVNRNKRFDRRQLKAKVAERARHTGRAQTSNHDDLCFQKDGSAHMEPGAGADPGVWRDDDFDWRHGIEVNAVKPSSSGSREHGAGWQHALPTTQITPGIELQAMPAVEPSGEMPPALPPQGFGGESSRASFVQ